MTEKPNYSLDTGPIAMALIMAAILFSSAFYFAPSKTQILSQQNQLHLLSVSADASKEVTPDKVEIIFSVVSRGADPTAIQVENDAKLKQITAAIAALGVPTENIKTVGYSLDRWQEYNETQKKYVDMGYQLSNSLRVVSYDVTQAGKIVKGAVQNGANDISGITFSLADSTQKKLYNSLLQDAAASAKGKADAMATSAGVKIASLSSMNEGYNYVAPVANYNYRDMAMEAKAGAAPEVSISAGLVKVIATVNAQYEIAG
ncbi:MAG: SIMPL domain-containing protein [Candidatus Micrarchaeia archaeon]